MTQHHVTNLSLSYVVLYSMQLLKEVDFFMKVEWLNWYQNVHFLHEKKKAEGVEEGLWWLESSFLAEHSDGW